MSVPMYHRKPRTVKYPYGNNKKSIKTITAELDELEIDYNNFENDEIPNDFICFNVPITQSLNTLSTTSPNGLHSDAINPATTERANSLSSNESLSYSSASSSPVLSDDSFRDFPNLENNSNAFNVLDSEVQNLTLEFNSNADFLKSEKLIQQKINKKKINQISKKISKEEKFWIKFLNECYSSIISSSSTSNEYDSVNIFNKEFSNHFNIKISNHLNKFEIYNNILANDKGSQVSRFSPRRSSALNSVISCSSSSSTKNSPRNSANINSDFMKATTNFENEFIPNVVEDDLFELGTKQYVSTFGLNDLRYKKKYALPNNSSVENLGLSSPKSATFASGSRNNAISSTNNNNNNGGSTVSLNGVVGTPAASGSLYSIVNATNNSTTSVDSVNTTFSLSLKESSDSSASPTSLTSSPSYSFYKQQQSSVVFKDTMSQPTSNSANATPRSSVLGVSSFSSLFRVSRSPSITTFPPSLHPTSTTSSINSISSLNKTNGKVVPEWWLYGLSTSPLPPLMLKFSLANNGYINETIDSMNLRSIVWYLTSNNFLNMNESTFKVLLNDVNVFLQHLNYYIKLATEIEYFNDCGHNDNNSGLNLAKVVQKLKSFLAQFNDKDKFHCQLSIFKKVKKEISQLTGTLSVSMQQDLQNIVLCFYYYLFDIGTPNVSYNKEVISMAYMLLTNIKNTYLTFSCLINLTCKTTKMPLLRQLIVNTQNRSSTSCSSSSLSHEENQEEENQEASYISEDQEAINNNTIKTFVKVLKNYLPELYQFLKTELNFDSYTKFNRLVKFSIQKIFNLESVIKDQSHRLFLERIFDIAFLDKNNNWFIYLLVLFLKQHQNEFLVNLKNKLKLGNFRVFNLKQFIHKINDNTNELLFKNSNATDFMNEIKTVLLKDVNSELTLDDAFEFEQLGLEI